MVVPKARMEHTKFDRGGYLIATGTVLYVQVCVLHEDEELLTVDLNAMKDLSEDSRS